MERLVRVFKYLVWLRLVVLLNRVPMYGVSRILNCFPFPAHKYSGVETSTFTFQTLVQFEGEMRTSTRWLTFSF